MQKSRNKESFEAISTYIWFAGGMIATIPLNLYWQDGAVKSFLLAWVPHLWFVRIIVFITIDEWDDIWFVLRNIGLFDGANVAVRLIHWLQRIKRADIKSYWWEKRGFFIFVWNGVMCCVLSLCWPLVLIPFIIYTPLPDELMAIIIFHWLIAPCVWYSAMEEVDSLKLNKTWDTAPRWARWVCYYYLYIKPTTNIV